MSARWLAFVFGLALVAAAIGGIVRYPDGSFGWVIEYAAPTGLFMGVLVTIVRILLLGNYR